MPDTTADLVRECARCGRVLVAEDGDGWYYQVPVTDSGAPGLTFMDRVYRCGGEAHDVRPRGERLALHLVSAHCDGMAVARPHQENVDQHAHEHRGPGTIRNHPLASLIYDDQKVELVLEELEEADA